MSAEYIAQRGNLDIVLCERGIRTFEPSTRNTLDISAVPVVQATSHLPIIVDPSHASGRKDLVVPLSRAAIAVGADGVIVDVHPDPESALCDGPQALLGADLRALAQAVRQLPPALGQDGKGFIAKGPVPGDRGARLRAEGAQQQVLLHRQLREEPPALGHQRHAEVDDLLRGKPGQIMIPVVDA